MTETIAEPWWRARDGLSRFVCDLMAGDLARLRPGRAVAPLPWDGDMRLEEDLGADSLERLHLATALGEAIHLHRSGVDDALLAQRTIGEWVAVTRVSLDAFSAELTFRTSGTTGRPKWSVHRLSELEAEIAAFVPVLGDVRRIVSAVPAHHIYGFLFTLLAPARLAAEVIDVRRHAPAQLAGLLRPGDAIVGHPAFWRAFVRGVPQVPSGTIALSSTAPCPPELAHDVRARGIDRLIEIYGSSETAGIGWRDDPESGFALLPYWRRGAGESELVRVEAGGGERVVVSPDRLTWDDARHVRPAGRSEGAVQVGGTNVVPEQIAAVLATHPAVAAAAVRLMRPDEGDRLKAFVVPRSSDADPAALIAILWPWIDARLSVAERPKSIVVGASLPSGELGKAADWPIPEPAGERDALK